MDNKRLSKLKKYIIQAIVLSLQIFCLSTTYADNSAYILNVNDAIGPAVADYINNGIEQANENNAELVIIQLDTPGGLDKSMRTIIKKILSSDTPVVTFVAPGGARAASAGTYILYASHVAVMAPGTNLGAATPVPIGGEASSDKSSHDARTKNSNKENQKSEENESTAMEKKMVNDATAYIESLSELRGRNVKWAKQAVTSADSISAKEAKQKNVIDLIANDLSNLLDKINGMKLTYNGQTKILNTKNIQIKKVEPSLKNKILTVITDPSVAYILLLIAMYGIFFEFANPGFFVPGIVGAISLLLALYAFQLLPIDYSGFALLFFGVALMIAEAFVPSFGILGIGGVIAFIVGSLLLFDTAMYDMGVSWQLVLLVTFANILFFSFVLTMAIRARQRKVISGSEQLIGSIATVIADFESKGEVHVYGEIWQAHSDVALQRGQDVLIVSLDGLVLNVKPIR